MPTCLCSASLTERPMLENSSSTVSARLALRSKYCCVLNDKESSFQENQDRSLLFHWPGCCRYIMTHSHAWQVPYHRFCVLPIYKWRHPLLGWALSSNDKWGLSAYVFPALAFAGVVGLCFRSCLLAVSLRVCSVTVYGNKRSPFAELALLALIGGASKHPLFLSSQYLRLALHPAMSFEVSMRFGG